MRHTMPLAFTLALAGLSASLPAGAASSDRQRPMNIESEGGGEVNKQTNRVEFSGNVVLTQGTLQLRAKRMEVLTRADGSHHAIAAGAPGEPVRFEQASDKPGERIAGSAERVEYDGRDETARFMGSATVRRFVGPQVADEMTGAQITYNSRAETLTLAPGQTSPQEGGRVRVTMMPRATLSPVEVEASGVKLQTTPALAPKPPSR
jgi:lipopolysaccharide export system protein LptA